MDRLVGLYYSFVLQQQWTSLANWAANYLFNGTGIILMILINILSHTIDQGHLITITRNPFLWQLFENSMKGQLWLALV